MDLHLSISTQKGELFQAGVGPVLGKQEQHC